MNSGATASSADKYKAYTECLTERCTARKSTSKQPTGDKKTARKSTGGRRTARKPTGGKQTARKSTGGKLTARKSTGGKQVVKKLKIDNRTDKKLTAEKSTASHSSYVTTQDDMSDSSIESSSSETSSGEEISSETTGRISTDRELMVGMSAAHASYVSGRQRQDKTDNVTICGTSGSSTEFSSEASTGTEKISPSSNVSISAEALYEAGIRIESNPDLCDCLNEECEGCFYDCPKCGSQKCGAECRIYRKYIIDQTEYEGY